MTSDHWAAGGDFLTANGSEWTPIFRRMKQASDFQTLRCGEPRHRSPKRKHARRVTSGQGGFGGLAGGAGGDFFADGGAIDPAGGDGRERAGLRGAAFVAVEFRDQDLGGAQADVRGLLVEAGAGRGGVEEIEGDEAVRFWNEGAARGHPLDRLGLMAEDDVGLIFFKPGGEVCLVDVVGNEQGNLAAVGIVLLKGEEGGLPAVLEALVVMALHKHAGAAVTAGHDLLERGGQRAVVIGADRVERGAFDHVVGVDAGVAVPVEGAKIGVVPDGHEDEALDAARLEDLIEAVERDAGVAAGGEELDLEAEGGGALGGAAEQFAEKGPGVDGAVGLGECDRGEDAAKRIAAGAAQLGHDGAGERVGLVAGGFGGELDALGGGGFDAAGSPQCFGDGGAREA
jgi:hypothetical protein